jgi:hypothetical protein
MPYVIRPPRLRTAIAACAAMLLVGAVPAQAAKSSGGSTSTEITSPSQCKEPVLSQPFLYVGDENWYTLAPGQAANNFEAKGWSLSGGASLKSAVLENGKTGSVLDLPSGAKAVSPNFCITQAYPTARAIVRNVVGSEGVFFYVSYLGTASWENPKNTGQVHGSGSAWTPVTPVNMQPYGVEGWQVVKLTLVPGGTKSDFQLYNLYIDPYVRR